MIAVALLAMALCAAGPSVPDHAFAEGVELFIIGTMPLDRVAPARTWRLIRMLGCGDARCGYDCRELAEEELGWLGRDAWRPLLLAADRHRDPEVRQRARRLLDDLAYCPDCRGTGLGRFLYDVPDRDWRVVRLYFDPCPACRGTGARR